MYNTALPSWPSSPPASSAPQARQAPPSRIPRRPSPSPWRLRRTPPTPVPVDFNSALGVAATQFGLAKGNGTLAGGAVRAIASCALGATVGAAVLPAFFLATEPADCLVGKAFGATIGPVVGAGLLGIPVSIASAVQMNNHLHPQG